MDKENKTQQIQNKKLFKNIRGVLVIQARHLGRRHGKLCAVNRPYYWKVDRKTHHIKRLIHCHKNNLATVADKKHENHTVVIVKCLHPQGKMAVAGTRGMKYVLNIQPKHLNEAKHEVELN